MGERLPCKQEVSGSNPLISTIEEKAGKRKEKRFLKDTHEGVICEKKKGNHRGTETQRKEERERISLVSLGLCGFFLDL